MYWNTVRCSKALCQCSLGVGVTSVLITRFDCNGHRPCHQQSMQQAALLSTRPDQKILRITAREIVLEVHIDCNEVLEVLAQHGHASFLTSICVIGQSSRQLI